MVMTATEPFGFARGKVSRPLSCTPKPPSCASDDRFFIRS
jgi:hypothetical protein